jgi:arginyl-tRNA synthetase
MYPIEACQNDIKNELRKLLTSYQFTDDIRLDVPPQGLGDFAFPCFPLASLAKKAPAVIAQELAQKIPRTSWILKAEAHGPYVNFYIDVKSLAVSVLSAVFEKKERYGYLPSKHKKVIIEHTSANPNGPLHVGRARNPIIGDTLVRLFKAAGYHVESQFYLDDMGKQVAILTWGINNIPPQNIPKADHAKPDHQYVGFYQQAHERMTTDDSVEAAVNELVKNSERGDQHTLKMIHTAYTPVLKGIQESLSRINITIDTYIPESTFVKDKSVEQVVDALQHTTYCHEEDNAYYLDMEPFHVHGKNTKFFFLRSDGTTLYATRDIAYHLWKARNAQLLVNILGEDHRLESTQVAIALQLLKEKTLPQVVFYAFVSLPGGKMSTRKGRVVYLDDLIDECIERAYEEVKKRRAQDLTEEQMRHIAEIVGIGSLRYNIIKVQPEKDIVFRWEDALNFEGNAVPFIQYAHARASSILTKTHETHEKIDASCLKHPSEIMLIKQLASLPGIIEDACNGCKPHLLANYLYDTASAFNQFYRDCPVLVEEDTSLREARIALVKATKIVLHTALNLLGITAPEEM